MKWNHSAFPTRQVEERRDRGSFSGFISELLYMSCKAICKLRTMFPCLTRSESLHGTSLVDDWATRRKLNAQRWADLEGIYGNGVIFVKRKALCALRIATIQFLLEMNAYWPIETWQMQHRRSPCWPYLSPSSEVQAQLLPAVLVLVTQVVYLWTNCWLRRSINNPSSPNQLCSIYQPNSSVQSNNKQHVSSPNLELKNANHRKTPCRSWPMHQLAPSGNPQIQIALVLQNCP
jgi:hypothetical protein